MQRVSRDAGFYLHWSGDSRRLHWALGPELFTRDLADTFAFVDGSRGSKGRDEPEAKGVNIGFTVHERHADRRDRARRRAHHHDGRPQAGRDRRHARRDRERAPSSSRATASWPSVRGIACQMPAGATRIDVKGKTIMPGIIDVHAHLGGESSGLLAQANWPLAANLAFGVTTSHDPSNDTETVFTNAELVRAGAKLGPRLFSTGTILYGAETPFKAVDRDLRGCAVAPAPAEGRRRVQREELQPAAARRAADDHQGGARARDAVVPEGGSLLYMNQTHVLDGHTGVEHSLPVPRLYKDTIELFAKSTVGYTPTLIVGYGGLSGEYYWYQHTNVWENERLLRFTPREVVDARSRRRTDGAGGRLQSHPDLAKGAKQILDAGGRCSSARTGSCRASARTGSCGCCSRAA